MPTALLSGITGQAGSYLAELLLARGYEVHGLIRRASSFNTDRIDHIFGQLQLHHADLTEPERLAWLLRGIEPDEVYHLGAQSHVRVSFDTPGYTAAVTGLGTQHLLEAVFRHRPEARVYVACSSEMFGASPPPQDEATPLRPRSPYACAKVYSFHLARHYRDRGLFVSAGILFNHESERRGETFVTRKITRALARIRLGLQNRLQLGNLQARRDWGHAEDYVRAMWLMLQEQIPDDYVIATGESHSVEDFLGAACAWHEIEFPDERVEVGVQRLLRPTEVDALEGDASKARTRLGWEPRITFSELVDRMCEADYRLALGERAAAVATGGG